MSNPNPSNAAKRALTTCKRGHPYDGENTYVKPDGTRGCKRCRGLMSSRSSARGRLQAALDAGDEKRAVRVRNALRRIEKELKL